MQASNISDHLPAFLIWNVQKRVRTKHVVLFKGLKHTESKKGNNHFLLICSLRVVLRRNWNYCRWSRDYQQLERKKYAFLVPSEMQKAPAVPSGPAPCSTSLFRGIIMVDGGHWHCQECNTESLQVPPPLGLPLALPISSPAKQWRLGSVGLMLQWTKENYTSQQIEMASYF